MNRFRDLEGFYRISVNFAAKKKEKKQEKSKTVIGN